jgi:large subunit ribosomal protein L24
MKFKVGDKVVITAGKDKGKTGNITRVIMKSGEIVVSGINLYTRHVRPYAGKSGEKIRRERPLPAAKIAIINDKGQPDRIGYQISKSGSKDRIYKKTGAIIPAGDKQKSDVAAVKPVAQKAAAKKTEKKAAPTKAAAKPKTTKKTK